MNNEYLDEVWLSTEEFVKPLNVKPSTARHSLCIRGHYLGIVPIKPPNGRLLWPKSERDKLLQDSTTQQFPAT